jgi:hypothetical protein
MAKFNALNLLNQLNDETDRSIFESSEMNSSPALSTAASIEYKSNWGRYVPLSVDHPALEFIDFSRPAVSNDKTTTTMIDFSLNNNNFSYGSKPSFSSMTKEYFEFYKTCDNLIEIRNHTNELLTELPISFKIDLQKDLVSMLEIMKKEYCQRLGSSNEYSIKAIKAYKEAKDMLDDYDKYF